MANFPIQVEVIPDKVISGTKKVKGQLGSIEKAGERLQRTLNRVFAFVGITAGIRQLGRLVDAYTNIQNRLKNVTTGTNQLIAVTQELFKIANKTRTSYESTAEVYARTALSLKSLGISQKRTLEFTQSLNQAIVLSGASAQEASNAMIQLAQGMSSNRLSGEELRSVLEQLPQVADVIAKSMKVTRGELRDLGAAGKISAITILKAFEEAREELSEKFAKTVPTISQSFAVFHNRLIEVIGGLDQTTSASATLSKGILLLAKNIETLIRSVIALGIALSVGLVQKGIRVAIVAIKALGLAIATNPIGAIAIAAVGAISALTAFADKIQLTADGMVTLRDAALATFTVLSEKVKPIASIIKNDLNSAFESVIKTIKNLNITFEGVLKTIKKVVNTWIGLFVGLGFAMEEIFNQLNKLVLDYFGSNILTIIATYFQTLFGYVTKVFKGILTVATTVLASVGIAVVELGKLINESFDLPDLTVPDSVVKFGSNVKKAFLKGFTTDFVGKALDGILPVFNEIATKARENAVIRITEEKRIADSTKSGLASLLDSFKSADNKISGFRTQVVKYFTKIEDLSTNLGKSLVGAFESAADAFADFVTKGKFDFKSLADSIISDIARIAIRQAIILPILQGLGFGVVAAVAPTVTPTIASGREAGNTIPFRANGGPATKGQPYVVGERRAELFVPNESGRIESSVPSGKASKTTVIVNNNGNGQASVEESTTADGQEIITVTVAEDIYNEGPVYQAIKNVTGVTARGV